MNLSDELKTNRNPLLILLAVPILLTIFRYYGWATEYSRFFNSNDPFAAQVYYFLSAFVLLGLIPLIIWLTLFRKNLADIGLSFGNVRQSTIFTLIGIPVMILIAFISAKDPAFRAEYPLNQMLLTDQSNLVSYLLLYGLYYIGWEIFFRGFMLFGLQRAYGSAAAILIQTIPSCIMHIGKPDGEIFASIIAGLIFGWITLKCRSFIPVLICHCVLGIALDLFIIYG